MELKQIPTPPKWAGRFFRWYCRPDRYEELAGDLEEMYALRTTRNKKWQADLAYIWDVLRCYRTYARKSNYYMNTSGALFQSFFKLSLRHMVKNKWTVAVNVLGMGIALSFCMLCYLLYGYNREFDGIYNTADFHRIQLSYDGAPKPQEMAPLALGPSLEQEHSAVEKVLSYRLANIDLKKNKYYFPTRMAFVSSEWLSYFDLPLKYGNSRDLKLQGVFLTEETALKLYGDVNPVGERLALYVQGDKYPDVEVLGVFKHIPKNSSFRFEAMANLQLTFKDPNFKTDNWEHFGPWYGHYAKIKAGQEKQVETHLGSYAEILNKLVPSPIVYQFSLTPFNDTEMMKGNVVGFANLRLAMKDFLIFCIMAGLILFIACFNLANSNLAIISSRIKEIGIRKTIGSSTRQIFIQYLFETFLIMFLAFMLSIASINLVSEYVLGLYGQPFSVYELNPLKIALFVGSFLVLVTLLTGLIPAIYARRFRPITILNHKVSLKGLSPVHYLLSIIQYGLSITVLLIGLSFMDNAQFMQNQDFGYDPEHLMVIRLEDPQEYEKLEPFITQQHFVKEVFRGYNYLGGYRSSGILNLEGQDIAVSSAAVIGDYLTRMGISFNLGRDFITDSQTDFANHLIVNRHFVDQYLVGNPIQQKIKWHGEFKTIIGVIDNFQDGELFLNYNPKPLVFAMQPNEDTQHMMIRTNGQDPNEVTTIVEELWIEQMDRPLSAHWQTEHAYLGSKEASENIRDIFMSLAVVAFLLSFISIASMASLRVTSSTKQITIRKVLGANLRQIFSHINRPFMIMLGLSLSLGIPIGLYLTETILASMYVDYSRTSVATSLGIGLAVILFAIFISSAAIYRPIRMNPANGLRTE
jgi:putative ABC transport system permease protein